jgi:hypothetical protein
MITLSHSRIRLIIYGLVLANIMAGVEGTIVATARPFIVSDLGRFDLTVWIFVAVSLDADRCHDRCGASSPICSAGSGSINSRSSSSCVDRQCAAWRHR